MQRVWPFFCSLHPGLERDLQPVKLSPHWGLASPHLPALPLPASLRPQVLFGKLFDETQDIFEALGGTLKAAKKQGLISYTAMILLKGAHDKVPIVLEQEAPEEA